MRERESPARSAGRRVALALALGAAAVLATVADAESGGPPRHAASSDEPITPLPHEPFLDPEKAALGERLFFDERLSRDGTASCASCHDLSSNGASSNVADMGVAGAPLPFNTPTVFNATLSFRFGWEGRTRDLTNHAASLFGDSALMGMPLAAAAARLRDDPVVTEQFQRAYDRPPDADALIDALATFERSLLTPGSRFDRWLAGDDAALGAEELEGYDLFKATGCAACHQGVGVGGNLFQRHGIFERLAAPEPAVLRVPSLRNVATTAPYFHDGSAATLEIAIVRMGRAQLAAELSDADVGKIAAFLRTLTGSYRGAPVRAP